MMKQDRYTNEIRSFGANVKSIRTDKGLTQLDVAEEMKVERSEISKIENGKLNVEFKTIVKIAEALEVDILELFIKKEVPKKTV